VPAASCFLRSIEPHIERNRECLNLPRRMIDYLLSEAQLDIGGLCEVSSHIFHTLLLSDWRGCAAVRFLIFLFLTVRGRCVLGGHSNPMMRLPAARHAG